MAQRIEEIGREIERLKKEYETAEGSRTEVYSRIVGYYRSIKNWNLGKREEYTHRVQFSNYEYHGKSVPVESVREEEPSAEPSSADPGLMYFYRANCPNCPPVSTYLSSQEYPVTKIDVDTESGLEFARKYDVLSTPTVILVDADGKVKYRGTRLTSIAPFLEENLPKPAYAS